MLPAPADAPPTDAAKDRPESVQMGLIVEHILIGGGDGAGAGVGGGGESGGKGGGKGSDEGVMQFALSQHTLSHDPSLPHSE